MQKKMFKVISPVEKGNGNTWWMRCGTAFVNKDESINVYLEALPLIATQKGEGVKLQLRELTDEELRERDSRKSSYSMRGGVGGGTGAGGGGSGVDSGGMPSAAFRVPPSSPNHTVDQVPF